MVSEENPQWVAAISAMRYVVGHGETIQVSTDKRQNICVVEANTKPDAENLALAVAKRHWPTIDGWQQHVVSVSPLDFTGVRIWTWEYLRAKDEQ